ncbi:hypothetical protein [Paludisphaera soli]|uniref:hypothetical protein n=1 Tax=Paludisphaera soli TaxID=2712865 RepID=UPI0013ED2EA0|nr:hypothetical protein [Paludisphaera soli]
MVRIAGVRGAAVALGAAWLLTGWWERPAAGQATEPRLPGAVTSCPAWLKSGAPFDMTAFFAEPPAGKNAAPLYFPAFAEFGPEVDACLPPPEKGRGQIPEATDRARRIGELYGVMDKTPESLDRKALDALLAELNDGYRKLAGVQRRPECAFAVGLTPDSLLPHAQAARTVARAVCLRIFRDAEKGNLERAIPDLAMILRLSRDLRPRGPAIVQLVSGAIDGIALLESLPAILRSPTLKVAHCDRLVALLREHDAGLDRFVTGAKAEYVMQRTFLRACQEKRLAQAGPDGRPFDKLLSITDAAEMVVATLNMATPDQKPAQANSVAAVEVLLRAHTPAWPQERRALDEIARAMTAPGPIRYADRIRQIEELKVKHLGGRIPDSLWVAQACAFPYDTQALSIARVDAYNRASQGLAAIRRWQLAHGGESPASFEAACKEAGLPAVPVDPFPLAPMKATVIDGRPVVYSIGPDGVDDKGRNDSNLGRRPQGDLVFRLPEPAK